MAPRRRAALFVDVTNLYYAANHRNGARIDFEKYLAAASEGFDVCRAFAYGAQMAGEAGGFLAVLRELGYEPKYRTAVVIGERPDIRRTDRNMPLAMDVWRLADRLDVAIIGSNDPDLAPLVRRIKEVGVQVVIFACGVGRELRELADRVIEVGEDTLTVPSTP